MFEFIASLFRQHYEIEVLYDPDLYDPIDKYATVLIHADKTHRHRDTTTILMPEWVLSMPAGKSHANLFALTHVNAIDVKEYIRRCALRHRSYFCFAIALPVWAIALTDYGKLVRSIIRSHPNGDYVHHPERQFKRSMAAMAAHGSRMDRARGVLRERDYAAILEQQGLKHWVDPLKRPLPTHSSWSTVKPTRSSDSVALEPGAPSTDSSSDTGSYDSGSNTSTSSD